MFAQQQDNAQNVLQATRYMYKMFSQQLHVQNVRQVTGFMYKNLPQQQDTCTKWSPNNKIHVQIFLPEQDSCTKCYPSYKIQNMYKMFS
jgi:hypothetical protein